MDRNLSNSSGLLNSPQVSDSLCPSCGLKGLSIFHEVKGFPVHTVLNIATREKALNYPRGDIVLGFCPNCGFISNVAFEPELLEYSSNCEESQGFSPTFNAFARRTAKHLIDKYDLCHKDIVEIGCGKGEFLTLLCELGENRGVGFDPVYVSGRNPGKNKHHITFIKDFYSEKYASYHGDFICCRMTLEHIHNTADFVGMVRRSIGNRTETMIFFQVPDVTRILKDCAFEDIYYEHCSYFSPGSLARLFRQCGFDVLDLSTEYDGQYLLLEAKPTVEKTASRFVPLENDIETLIEYVKVFRNNYSRMITYWKNTLQELKTHSKRAVLWGSGSKGVAFLITFNLYDDIEYVVDINPYRQGSYMAGTGQFIVAPDFLREYTPDIVIVMNPIYFKEIQQDLSRMGLHPEMLALGKGRCEKNSDYE